MKPKNYCEVIKLWPSQKELAEDVGTTKGAVRKWWERQAIPASAWPDVVSAARGRDYQINLELLASLRTRKRART